MSFAQPFSEAHGIQTAIQLHKTDGHSGEMSSHIRDGESEPGTAHEAPIKELVPRRTKIHTRTDMLERKYASTGSGGDGPHGGASGGHKDYAGGEIGQKNLRGR
jgi:hypothetical protein